MAKEAKRLLVDIGWLPEPLRLIDPDAEPTLRPPLMSKPTICPNSLQAMTRMKTWPMMRTRHGKWLLPNNLQTGRLRSPPSYLIFHPSDHACWAPSFQEKVMHVNIDTGAGGSPPRSEWETLDGLRRQLEAELFGLKQALLDVFAPAASHMSS